MLIFRFLAATATLFVFSSAASAATFNAQFPSAGSTTTASAGEFFFLPSHTVEETFNGTNVFDATLLELDLNIDPSNNFEASDQTINFDVLLNSLTVGSFSYSGSSGAGLQNFAFALVDPTPLSDSYTVRLEVTNSISPGAGSIDFLEERSFVTISGEMGIIPLPASVPLLASGLAIFGAMGWRRRKQHS